LPTGGQKWEYKKGPFNAVAMETLTLRIDSGTIQSLRNCNALTLMLLGQAKEMSQEAIGKIKGFIAKYSSGAFG